MPYLEKKSEELKEINEHYKVTTFTIKLMSLILKKYPAVYGYIKFGIYEAKEGIDICCLVNVGKGKELANTTIKNCEVKTLKEIHMELNASANLLKERKNKDDFFTDRESAIIFGIPANFIEGILVGRTYEKDKKVLNEIRNLLPNAYICNIDGKVI